MSLIATMLIASSAGWTSGCANGRRAVFIDADNSVFRIGPGGLKGRVYFKNAEGEWELTANKVELHEGWLVGSGK